MSIFYKFFFINRHGTLKANLFIFSIKIIKKKKTTHTTEHIQYYTYLTRPATNLNHPKIPKLNGWNRLISYMLKYFLLKGKNIKTF